MSSLVSLMIVRAATTFLVKVQLIGISLYLTLETDAAAAYQFSSSASAVRKELHKLHHLPSLQSMHSPELSLC